MNATGIATEIAARLVELDEKLHGSYSPAWASLFIEALRDIDTIAREQPAAFLTETA